MKIPIKSNVRDFYRSLLMLMHSFAPINKLIPKEIEVLAEIMYQNYLNRDIVQNKRNIIVFSTENRAIMRNNLGMAESALNDYLSRIRRKGIITKNNELLPFLSIIPEDNKYELLIKFSINE